MCCSLTMFLLARLIHFHLFKKLFFFPTFFFFLGGGGCRRGLCTMSFIFAITAIIKSDSQLASLIGWAVFFYCFPPWGQGEVLLVGIFCLVVSFIYGTKNWKQACICINQLFAIVLLISRAGLFLMIFTNCVHFSTTGGGIYCAVASLRLMGFIGVDLLSNSATPSIINVPLLLSWILQVFSTSNHGNTWRCMLLNLNNQLNRHA